MNREVNSLISFHRQRQVKQGLCDTIPLSIFLKVISGSSVTSDNNHHKKSATFFRNGIFEAMKSQEPSSF